MEPDPETKELTVTTIHAGVDRQKIQEACGWKLRFHGSVGETPPPSEQELSILRDLQEKTRRAHLGEEKEVDKAAARVA